MKIKIVHEIEIDPKKWADAYGIDSNPEEVKKDIKSHFEGAIMDHLENLGFALP
jgi:hypothetical protein